MSSEVRANVLLVDDNPGNLLAMEAALEGLDLNIVMARSGTEALRQMLEAAFAIVIFNNERHEVAAALAVSRDITDRKRAEQALRQSEAKFSILFQKAPFAVMLSRLPGAVIAEVNEAFEKMFGYSKQEVTGKTSLDLGLYTAEDQERLIAEFQARGSLRDYELTMRTKSGEQRVMLVNSDLIEMDRQQFVLTTTQDITERKHTEMALRQSKQRLRSVIDGLGPHMFVGLMTPDGTLVEVNQPALAAAGLKREDVLGKPVEETYWWAYSEEVKERLREAIRRAARGEASRYDVQIRVGENEFIWIDFSVQPVWDETGRVVFLVPSASVITARKQAEERLQQVCDRLQALSRRILDIQEQERRRIAYELHDEIGQLWTALKLNLEAAIQYTDLETVHGFCREASRIADQAIQRARTLSLDLRPSVLDDFGLSSALRWFLDRQHQQAGLNIELRSDPALGRLPTTIEVTAFRIVQEAITNIIRHARAHTVTVEVVRRENELQVAITDDGIGFDVEAAKERAMRGESLGLLSMQERALLIGGSVEISSTPGRGTELLLRLPLGGEAG